MFSPFKHILTSTKTHVHHNHATLTITSPRFNSNQSFWSNFRATFTAKSGESSGCDTNSRRPIYRRRLVPRIFRDRGRFCKRRSARYGSGYAQKRWTSRQGGSFHLEFDQLHEHHGTANGCLFRLLLGSVRCRWGQLRGFDHRCPPTHGTQQ